MSLKPLQAVCIQENDMSVYYLNINELRERIPALRAGDSVYLSGICYTARDAAHKKLFSLLDEGREVPIEIKDACYFCAIGGAGALCARHIAEYEEIAFPELGCESIKRLVLRDFPVYVAIDCEGNSIYKD